MTLRALLTGLWAIALVAASAGISAAIADVRLALVIGNSEYRYVTPLSNPGNDAKLVAETLANLGFKLVGGGAQLDLNKAQFDQVVQDFGAAAQGVDVALFYYAGHGVQVNGANYLVPIGANPTRQADVDFQMLDVNLVLRQLDGARAKLNIVILDACRNNPFGGRGLRAVAGGLAQMQAPDGTLISFATQPGNVARDGSDGDSPFTRALVQTIKKPGFDIFRTFNEVGLIVARATGGEQQPWLSLSPIAGDFYFSHPLPSGADTGDQKTQLAALPPAIDKPNSQLGINPGDVTRLLQAHLKRVGCDPGDVSGEWNASSRRALETFNKNAGTHLNVEVASLDAIEIVRSKQSRVCPAGADHSPQPSRGPRKISPGGQKAVAGALMLEPASGSLSPGASVYVDDGTCPRGQIKKVIGGSGGVGGSGARIRQCVSRP